MIKYRTSESLSETLDTKYSTTGGAQGQKLMTGGRPTRLPGDGLIEMLLTGLLLRLYLISINDTSIKLTPQFLSTLRESLATLNLDMLSAKGKEDLSFCQENLRLIGGT